MKRILLSFTLLITLSWSSKLNAQVLLNEIYYNPASGEEEHIELYNSSALTQNLDCYTLVSYYKTANTSGFYVINFPSINLPAGNRMVLGSASTLDHQSGTYILTNNDFSWSALTGSLSSGSITNYLLNSSGTDYTTPSISNLNDILQETKGDAKFTTLLYNNGVLVNGLVINGGSSVPRDLKLMKDLVIPKLPSEPCAAFALKFSELKDTQLEYITSGIGQSNGASRSADGACGTWGKSSRPSGITLGTTNGASTTIAGSITVGGKIDCNVNQYNKREATYFVVNSSTSASVYPLVLQIYQDNGSLPGQLDAGDMILKENQLSTAPVAGAPNSNYTVELIHHSGAIVVAKSTAGCFETIQGITNGCSALPVHFKSITAARNKERVAIKWETASESNNRGFNVQRNTGSEWKTIAFVFSQADGGNSSSTLSYEYNDVNSAKGVSQYRVQQVDIDGKASFSEIRSVRGETMKKSVIAFPNPSMDGKVNLVLDDNSAKNVIVSDISGRIVKQYKNITTNNLTIDMLQSGMYSIQVTDLSTAEVSVEKVVIKKR